MTPLEIARASLAQCQGWQPRTATERKQKAVNVAHLEAFIARATNHPTAQPG